MSLNTIGISMVAYGIYVAAFCIQKWLSNIWIFQFTNTRNNVLLIILNRVHEESEVLIAFPHVKFSLMTLNQEFEWFKFAGLVLWEKRLMCDLLNDFQFGSLIYPPSVL